MENQAFIDSLMREIIQPGVDNLMNSRYFTELRVGTLSKKRLAGFAMQHYLSNHAINKGLAFCMVKNASNPPAYHQFVELFVEESSHPALMKRFGQAMGLSDEDFENEIMIFECVAHTAAIIRGMFLGTAAESRTRHAEPTSFDAIPTAAKGRRRSGARWPRRCARRCECPRPFGVRT